MSERQENIKRVNKNIAIFITGFCIDRMVNGQYDFHMNELVDSVAGHGVPVTYDSCSRILRLLRQQKKLDYKVMSRRDSLYRLLFFSGGGQEHDLWHPSLRVKRYKDQAVFPFGGENNGD